MCPTSPAATADHRPVRLRAMMVLTFGFFLAELVVGHLAGSTALIADAVHMLSDALALIVALYSMNLASRRAPRHSQFSYGYKRAEAVGALANSVFLVALCFSVGIEAVKRMIVPEPVERPRLVLGVGAAGLGVNLIGLLLFHDHSHHGHSHDHAPSHSPLPIQEEDTFPAAVPLSPGHPVLSDNNTDDIQNGDLGHTAPFPRFSRAGEAASPTSDMVVLNLHDPPHSNEANQSHHAHPEVHSTHGHSDSNMRGVFLHILGDALGSVAVMLTSGLAIAFESPDGPPVWLAYLDPAVSMLITLLITITTIPLIRRTSSILLQVAPPGLQLGQVTDQLLAIEGVTDIHELHVWQLTDFTSVATVHVALSTPQHYQTVSKRIKRVLHGMGVHSTTVQPEFNCDKPGTCEYACPKSCRTLVCCAEDEPLMAESKSLASATEHV